MYFIHVLYSCTLFMYFIRVIYSCTLFMYFIHVLNSCTLFMYFIHVLYWSNPEIQFVSFDTNICVAWYKYLIFLGWPNALLKQICTVADFFSLIGGPIRLKKSVTQIKTQIFELARIYFIYVFYLRILFIYFIHVFYSCILFMYFIPTLCNC